MIKSEKRRTYIESEIGKKKLSKAGKIGGKVSGAKHIIAFNKSAIGREKQREGCRKGGRATGAKNLAKTRAMIPTISQLQLSKALSTSDIQHYLEYDFPSIGRRGDIAIPSAKLIIEVDGSSHNGGMWCTKEEKQIDDKFKEEQIKSLGWKIIRFKNEEIENTIINVIERIKEEL